MLCKKIYECAPEVFFFRCCLLDEAKISEREKDEKLIGQKASKNREKSRKVLKFGLAFMAFFLRTKDSMLINCTSFFAYWAIFGFRAKLLCYLIMGDFSWVIGRCALVICCPEHRQRGVRIKYQGSLKITYLNQILNWRLLNRFPDLWATFDKFYFLFLNVSGVKWINLYLRLCFSTSS